MKQYMRSQSSEKFDVLPTTFFSFALLLSHILLPLLFPRTSKCLSSKSSKTRHNIKNFESIIVFSLWIDILEDFY